MFSSEGSNDCSSFLKATVLEFVDCLLCEGQKTFSVFRPVEWSNLTTELYENSEEFRREADSATAEVLNDNPFRKIPIGEEQIKKGVHYLLSEFAFMLFLPHYINEELVGYIYHKPWPVFEGLIAGDYTGKRMENIKFVRFPEF